MKKIFADHTRIFMDSWNQAYGNKILHLFFLLNICEKKHRAPVMYKGSNLDRLFDFNFETVDSSASRPERYFFVEPNRFEVGHGFIRALLFRLDSDYSLKRVVENARRVFLAESKLLSSTVLPDEDIMLKGHFFEYDLMPPRSVFDKYLTIKDALVQTIRDKYPDLTKATSVAVHYRGTDFNSHLRSVFKTGIALDPEYYRRAMARVEESLGDVVYHLFSDDVAFLVSIFEGRRCVIHDDDGVQDWAAMFLAPNVIQSNSSYCWTASLFNKRISIQPRHGYNYHRQTGSVPFAFAQPNAYLI